MNPYVFDLWDAVSDIPGYWWVCSVTAAIVLFEPVIWKKLGRWFPYLIGRQRWVRVVLFLIVAFLPVGNMLGLAWLLWEFYDGWKEGVRQNEEMKRFNALK